MTDNTERTDAEVDRAGMQKLAEEHEWLRDRVPLAAAHRDAVLCSAASTITGYARSGAKPR